MDNLIDVSSRMAKIKRPVTERYEDQLLFADDEQLTTEEMNQNYTPPAALLNVPPPDQFRTQVEGSTPGLFSPDLQQTLQTTPPPAPVLSQESVTDSTQEKKWTFMGMDNIQFLIMVTALMTGCLILSFIVSLMSPSPSPPPGLL